MSGRAISKKINPKKIIVLCIDIDDTLINHQNGKISFNGTPAMWLEFLTNLQMHCESNGFKLVVQIISAKASGNVDCTVNLVVEHLFQFLTVLTEDANVWFPPSPFVYHAMFHVEHRQLKKKILHNSHMEYIDNYQPIADNSLLPAIHICQRNVVSRNHTSKALVMRHISQHFNETVPASNLFLLDNDAYHKHDLESGIHAPQYTFVSAYELQRLCLFSAMERATACQQILANLDLIIKARITSILDAESIGLCVNLQDTGSIEIMDEVNTIQLLRTSKHSGLDRSNLHYHTHRVDEITRILLSINFDEHLHFFGIKAGRKLARSLPHVPRQNNEFLVAQAATQLSSSLYQEKCNFINSYGPIDVAVLHFIDACTTAIGVADPLLMKPMTWASFFAIRTPYTIKRNELMASFEQLRNMYPTVLHPAII